MQYLQKVKPFLEKMKSLEETDLILHWDGEAKPWETIANILKKSPNKVSKDNVFELLKQLAEDKTADPADTLWINNFLSWIQADDVNDEQMKKSIQESRRLIASDWLNKHAAVINFMFV